MRGGIQAHAPRFREQFRSKRHDPPGRSSHDERDEVLREEAREDPWALSDGIHARSFGVPKGM